MNTRKYQLASIVLALFSLALEVGVNRQWFSGWLLDSAWGISLGLMLIALALNVRIVKSMGIAKNAKLTSQIIILIVSLYAFLVYGLEVI